MTSDPFETNRILTEAEDKRVQRAKPSISDSDVERMIRVLMRLPLLDSGRREVSNAAWKICFEVELARQEIAERSELLPEWRTHIGRDSRKPLARAAVNATADWYWILTGKPVTRVSKNVDGKHGLQETSDLAKFLGEVFDVFSIKASPAGQIKTWKNKADAAELKERIHPDDLTRILASPDELGKLLQELSSSEQPE